MVPLINVWLLAAISTVISALYNFKWQSLQSPSESHSHAYGCEIVCKVLKGNTWHSKGVIPLEGSKGIAK
jgi:hypothetical protein